MSQIFQIVKDTVLSLIGLVFVVWLFWRALKNSEDPAKIIFKIIFSVALAVGEIFFVGKLMGSFQPGGPEMNFGQAFVLVSSVAGCGIILSIVWTPQISGFLFKPLTDIFDGGNVPPEPKPFYSIALAKRKLNKPLEAVVAIREQLAKFPNDFEGVTLLANIQAEDLKDLPSAEMTLNHFCDSENAPPKQVAAALTQLADWHLKFFQDVDSAHAALNRIVEKFPETELALVAKQRIAHLEGTGKILTAAQIRRPVFVPEGVKNVGLLESSAHLAPAEANPEQLAGAYVKHLEQHPDDTEAREKLAVIYADHYQRLDLAAGELMQMADEPNHPPKRVAYWLNLLADLQIHHGVDYETVRETLQKIVERFPDLPVASLAQSRLAHLKLEIKGQQQKAPNKTLGVYEQNVGLKSSRSY